MAKFQAGDWVWVSIVYPDDTPHYFARIAESESMLYLNGLNGKSVPGYWVQHKDGGLHYCREYQLSDAQKAEDERVEWIARSLER